VAEFLKATDNWYSRMAVVKTKADRDHVAISPDYVTALSAGDMQDHLAKDQKAVLRSLPDINRLIERETHKEDDTFYARDHLPRTPLPELFNNFAMDVHEWSHVFDIILPPSVVLPGKFADLENLVTHADMEALKHMVIQRIPKNLYSRVHTVARLVHSDHGRVVRFVAQCYEHLGLPPAAMAMGNDIKSLERFFSQRDVLVAWSKILKRVSIIRHHKQVDVRYIRTQFCTRLISSPTFADALNQFIGDRLKAWTNLYSQRARSYAKHDRGRRVRDQLRGRFVPLLHFFFDDTDVCHVDGWHSDAKGALASTILNYIRKRRDYHGDVPSKAEIERWGWDPETIASYADLKLNPACTFSNMLVDVQGRGNLIADDVTNVFIALRVNIRKRLPYEPPDIGLPEEEAPKSYEVFDEEPDPVSEVIADQKETAKLEDKVAVDDFDQFASGDNKFDDLSFLGMDLDTPQRTVEPLVSLLEDLEGDLGIIYDWQREAAEKKYPEGVPIEEISSFSSWFLSLKPPANFKGKGQKRIIM